MLPSAQEHYRSRDEQRSVDLQAQRRQLTLLAQAEVLAGNMTRVPEWNLFLSYVSAAAEECERQIDLLRTKVSDPMVVQHDEVMRLKVLLEGWQQRRLAFDAVMSLPKDLLDMGQSAKALLERMPELEKAS